MVDQHSHDLRALVFFRAVDVKKEFIIEGDAADPDVEALSHDMSVLLAD